MAELAKNPESCPVVVKDVALDRACLNNLLSSTNKIDADGIRERVRLVANAYAPMFEKAFASDKPGGVKNPEYIATMETLSDAFSLALGIPKVKVFVYQANEKKKDLTIALSKSIPSSDPNIRRFGPESIGTIIEKFSGSNTPPKFEVMLDPGFEKQIAKRPVENLQISSILP